MITNAKSSSRDEREVAFPSDREVIRKYLGIDRFPCKMNSPIRDDDKKSSFCMQEKDGKIYWKDFGNGKRGDAVSLMAALWDVSSRDAYIKILNDLQVEIPGLERKRIGKVKLLKDASYIKVRVREWKDWDREYWSSYGIPESFCKACNVYPISHAFFVRVDEESGESETTCLHMDKYAYAYFEWKDGKESVKLYQPFSSTLKWLSKNDGSVWDLWKQAFIWAEKKDDSAIIITSSRKDAMCLWYNLKIPAISLQGEGFIPKPHVMKQIMDRFRKVYIWYDNDFTHQADNPGQDNAKKLCEAYPQLVNVFIPDKYGCKDPSDLFKKYGNNAKTILKEILESTDATGSN